MNSGPLSLVPPNVTLEVIIDRVVMDTDPVHEVGALMVFEVTHIEVDTAESLPSSLLHEGEPERIIALLQQQNSLVVTG